MLFKCFRDDITDAWGREGRQEVGLQPLPPSGLLLEPSRGTLSPSLADSFRPALPSRPLSRCRDLESSGVCISAEGMVWSWKTLSRSEVWAGGRLATQGPSPSPAAVSLWLIPLLWASVSPCVKQGGGLNYLWSPWTLRLWFCDKLLGTDGHSSLLLSPQRTIHHDLREPFWMFPHP